MKRWLSPSIGLLTTVLVAYGCTKTDEDKDKDGTGGTSATAGKNGSGDGGDDSDTARGGESPGQNGGSSNGGSAGKGVTLEGGAAGAEVGGDSPGGEGPGGGTAGSGGSGVNGGTGGTAGSGGAGGNCPSVDTTFKAGTVVWEEDFETDAPDWSVTGGVWAVGKPTNAKAPAPFSGKGVAGTGLVTDYPNGKDAWITSPEIDVPAAKQNPRVRFNYWYELAAGDTGYVAIRVDGGGWQYLTTLDQSGDGDWRQQVVYLGKWADHKVQLGFRQYTSAAATAAGFFIDDVVYETGAAPFASDQGFEGGWDYWTSYGQWAIGVPTAADGPKPVTGKALAGTILSGDYHNGNDSWLVSPAIDVPSAKLNPHASMRYWYELSSGDSAYVAISVDNGGWQYLSTLEGSGDGQWYNLDLSLAKYANQRVQIGFRMYSSATTTAPGFYIDDFHYQTCLPGLVSPQGFEEGWQGWSAYGGVWAVGEPTAADGPTAHTGKALAGTVLSGDYEPGKDAYLVSPIVVVPKDAKAPQLSYWYWYDLAAGDSAYTGISVDGGGWQWVDTLEDSGSGAWRQKKVDLTPYKDHEVRVAYRLYTSAAANSLGYYIDDVTFNLK